MSTLVKLIMAIALHLASPGAVPDAKTTTTSKAMESRYDLEDLNPDYIITRDEYLSYTKDTAI
jgi:hypothetical protein